MVATKLYIITTKVEKNTLHNPRDKKTGICPFTGGECTDITGEHHSFLTMGTSIQDVYDRFSQFIKITRIEHAEQIEDFELGYFGNGIKNN